MVIGITPSSFKLHANAPEGRQAISYQQPMNARLVMPSLVVAATLFLTGCIVTSDRKPLQQGPVNDEALVGDWRAVDAESGKLLNAFIHIQKIEEAALLRVVSVKDNDYVIHELAATQAGGRKVLQ